MQRIRVFRYRDSKFDVVSKSIVNLSKWISENVCQYETDNYYRIPISCEKITIDEYLKFPTI